MDKIKVVTICGSMKFKNEMMKIATNLEKEKSWCVLQCVYTLNNDITDDEMQKVVNAHFKRIDISDAIFVVNVGGYIGNSTSNEIDYAKSKGKEVFYYEN